MGADQVTRLGEAEAVPLLSVVPDQAPEPPKPGPTRARPAPAPAQVEEEDLPSDDDEIVETTGNEAEELVLELFDAELIKEEDTRPPSRRK